MTASFDLQFDGQSNFSETENNQDRLINENVDSQIIDGDKEGKLSEEQVNYDKTLDGENDVRDENNYNNLESEEKDQSE